MGKEPGWMDRESNEPIERRARREFDSDRLVAIVEAIEDYVRENKPRMSSANKANLIVAVYELLVDQPKTPDKAHIIRFIRRIA
jgi:hypothetical protein